MRTNQMGGEGMQKPTSTVSLVGLAPLSAAVIGACLLVWLAGSIMLGVALGTLRDKAAPRRLALR